MFYSHFQSGPENEHRSHDPFEQLISNASKQYNTLRYCGPPTLGLPTTERQQGLYDRWRWLATAAVLVVIVATMGIWFPADQALTEPAVIANWQPETRQPSPHAALAVARMVLANRTTYPRPERPPNHGFRLPGAPSRASGFAADREQPS